MKFKFLITYVDINLRLKTKLRLY